MDADPKHKHALGDRQASGRLRKNSILSWLLRGAAVHRRDKSFFSLPASAAEVDYSASNEFCRNLLGIDAAREVILTDKRSTLVCAPRRIQTKPALTIALPSLFQSKTCVPDQ